jgi:hypothetical protein
MQKLLLDGQRQRLRENQIATGRAMEADEDGPDHKPVVKLFCPWGGGTWLLTELDDDDDRAFGLCDLGMGFPELGYVSLGELRAARGPGGLYIERDSSWEATAPLSDYTAAASVAERIVSYLPNPESQDLNVDELTENLEATGLRVIVLGGGP